MNMTRLVMKNIRMAMAGLDDVRARGSLDAGEIVRRLDKMRKSDRETYGGGFEI